MKQTKADKILLDFLNDIADQLIEAGFNVDEPTVDHELLDVWSKDKAQGFIEIYLGGWHSEHNPDGGVFMWSIGYDETGDNPEHEFDIEIINGDCTELIESLELTFKKGA